jgi:hypothetical protein
VNRTPQGLRRSHEGAASRASLELCIRLENLAAGKEELALGGKEELALAGKMELVLARKKELALPGKNELALAGKKELAQAGKEELAPAAFSGPAAPATFSALLGEGPSAYRPTVCAWRNADPLAGPTRAMDFALCSLGSGWKPGCPGNH